MSSLAAGKKDGWSARLGNYAEPQSNALPPASFSPEEAVVALWQLKPLRKRLFMVRALAILAKL